MGLGQFLEQRPAASGAALAAGVAAAAGELEGEHRAAACRRRATVICQSSRAWPSGRSARRACSASSPSVAPDRAVVEAERREAVGERAHRVDPREHLLGRAAIGVHDLDERAGHVGSSPASFRCSWLHDWMVARGRAAQSRCPVSRGAAFRTLAPCAAPGDTVDELYAIGGGRAMARTGIGYSPEEDAAHELARGWLEEAGLEVRVDEAGNMFGGTDPRLDRAPTSTPFRRAASSTVRSAWSPRSRRSSVPGAGRSRSSARRSAAASARGPAPPRGRFRSVRRAAHRAGPAPRGGGRAARGRHCDRRLRPRRGRRRGRGRPRRDDADGACATTRSSRRRG